MTATTVLPYPPLTTSEHEALRDFLGMPPTASQKAVEREWARNYWYNHGLGFRDGDPTDGAYGVPVDKLTNIRDHYESDYRGILDRRP